MHNMVLKELQAGAWKAQDVKVAVRADDGKRRTRVLADVIEEEPSA